MAMTRGPATTSGADGADPVGQPASWRSSQGVSRVMAPPLRGVVRGVGSVPVDPPTGADPSTLRLRGVPPL